MHPHLIILDLLSNIERTSDAESHDLEQLTLAVQNTERVEINSKKQLFEYLHDLPLRVKKIDTILHFCAHGSVAKGDPDYRSVGLHIGSSSENVEWSNLQEPLEQLNNETGGRLILNIMACRGANAFKIDSFDSLKAFRAVIGPHRDISVRNVLIHSTTFYTKVVEGSGDVLELPTYLSEINDAEKEEVFNLVTSSYLRRRAIILQEALDQLKT